MEMFAAVYAGAWQWAGDSLAAKIPSAKLAN